MSASNDRRPLLIDLFCCAGGATKGYQRAGFYVVGVDIEDHPNYCGDDFIQADAIKALEKFISGAWPVPAVAVHASPPCHDHSNLSGRNRKATGPKGTGWMLDETIRLLRPLQLPWVVENVETAEMPPQVYRMRLCGSSFGLDVRRHRWFASNLALMAPPCAHSLQIPRFRSLDSRRAGLLSSVVGVHGHLNYPGEFELRCKAMGIDWMTNAELSQAIPPAYTEWIGEQMMTALEVAA